MRLVSARSRLAALVALLACPVSPPALAVGSANPERSASSKTGPAQAPAATPPAEPAAKRPHRAAPPRRVLILSDSHGMGIFGGLLDELFARQPGVELFNHAYCGISPYSALHGGVTPCGARINIKGWVRSWPQMRRPIPKVAALIRRVRPTAIVIALGQNRMADFDRLCTMMRWAQTRKWRAQVRAVYRQRLAKVKRHVSEMVDAVRRAAPRTPCLWVAPLRTGPWRLSAGATIEAIRQAVSGRCTVLPPHRLAEHRLVVRHDAHLGGYRPRDTRHLRLTLARLEAKTPGLGAPKTLERLPWYHRHRYVALTWARAVVAAVAKLTLKPPPLAPTPANRVCDLIDLPPLQK